MIEAQHITKAFQGNAVLSGVSFSIEAGHTLSVLGQSGCGKTTLLRILAGLAQADQGTFSINGQAMLELPPQQRQVVYLSQTPLLFPHLNTWENIAFGLRLRNIAPDSIRQQTEAMLAQLGLEEHGQKMPEQLSGGQRQRAAFGRAIIIKPRILLLDEPFGSLDAETRTQMQSLFLQLRNSHQITALFVTHDLKEALLMGHSIGRMQAGQLTVFPSLEAFAQDPCSGVQEEQAFWKQFGKTYQKPPKSVQ